MKLGDSVKEIKGVGDALHKQLLRMGIATILDLLQYYPRRYDDYSLITPISKLKPGPVTIEGIFKQVTGRYVRRGMHITEAVVSDKTGSVRIVWFNQPYRKNAIVIGSPYYISGQFELSYQRLSIMNPSCEKVSDFPVNTARVVPVYRQTKTSLTSNQLRKLLKTVLQEVKIPESLPQWIVEKQKLIPVADAITTMHFPTSMKDLEASRRRLGFEEVFGLSLAALLNKQANESEAATIVPFKQKLAKDFVGHLPFALTDDQRRVVWQLYQDMAKPQPMNRLVEGDVGSGKTVVATMAALMAMEQGFQVAFMAPTELLAQQHAETIHRMLSPLGYAPQVALLTGSVNKAARKQIHNNIVLGKVRLLIGTHALIEETVVLDKLGLVIIDEQHRFGVEQRKKLLGKSHRSIHVLTMTATPIPRSLALTLYGELDISTIKQKPAKRLPIITELTPPSSRQLVYDEAKKQLQMGRQLFVVCPLIDESDNLDARSAEKVFGELKKSSLQKYSVGLIHGKLSAADKQQVMQAFIDKKIDILVSTTVIEVGVDVPNATVMMIESPERFGLAQLHQLRGRVGRSSHQGYCYLMLSDSQRPSRRLQALLRSNDGFKLAELDLELRGPGALYGTSQHGQLDLRVATLSDKDLINAARHSAQAFLDAKENLLNYTYLAARVERLRAVTNVN